MNQNECTESLRRVAEFKKQGFDGYITKPINPNELKTEISKYFSEH